MKRFYKDERGSSLVLTIIAMTFISLLAVAVISMTITNIRLKIAQKGSQKNFYNTDSIMDEVRAGVEDLAAQAAVDAYVEAFSNFNASLSGDSVDLEAKYKKKFLEKMIEAISDKQCKYGDTDLFYKDEVIKNYLILNSDTNAAERYLPHKDTGEYPSGVTIDSKTYGHMLLENDTLLLQDVRVTMTEGYKDYKTTVTSDIRVTVPPMTADTYSEYLNYALIADNQIITDASASVEGNMYAGTVRRYQSGASNPETGILVKGGFTLDAKSEQIVTRGDLVVDGGSKFLLDGYKGSAANLWVENIFTKGNAKNVMTLNNAVCNVSDDMEIGGKSDEVTIVGAYMGYNYNANYKDAELTQVSDQSQYSSAILINGMGANLNLSGLNKLILSGKTFISKKTEPTEVDLRFGAAKQIENKDIAMGESLSVKGSQIAYYVPTDFVTSVEATTAWNPSVNHDDTSKREYTFRSSDNPNTEYTFKYGSYLKYLYGLDPNTATDAELDAKMGNAFKLWDYLNAAEPLVTYYRHNTAVDANAVSYFYLNFKSDVERMKFYPQFQQIIPRYSTVKDTNAAYMGSTGISIDENTKVYNAAGNVLYRDPSSTGDVKIKLANESNVADSLALQRYATSKTQEYMSMQLALVEAYSVAQKAVQTGQYRLLDAKNSNLSKEGTKDKTNLYNVLIDADQMAAKTDLFEDTNKSKTGAIIIEPRANKEYVWNSAAQSKVNGLNTGIIIAAGDVKVQKDFSGLIIAGGDITLASTNVKVSANNVKLEEMFTEDKAMDKPLFYNLFSKYFQKVVNAAIGQEDDETQEVVFYERWKKE